MLDAILKAYIEENRGADEIAATLPDVDPSLVRRTVRMVNAAEYKRQQAPPTLKVTAKAFGMGRRIPIAQKFYE